LTILLRWLIWLTLAAIAFFAPSRALAENEPLRVGLSGTYPPFSHFDEAGNLAGFDVDVARELCKKLDRECVFRILPWDGILSALLARKIDVIIGSMAITEEREKQVLFTSPYYESGAQLFVRENAPPITQRGFRLGVTLGTTYGQIANSRFPEAEVRTYKGDVAILQDIKSGRLDGMVTDRLVGLHLSERYGARIVPQGELLYTERMAIPVHPDDRGLHADLDRAVQELRGSEAYAQIRARYFGDEQAGVVGDGAFSWRTSLWLLARALWATIEVSAAGIALGLILAVILAALLLWAPGVIARPLAFYVDFIRSTPFLIQLFTVYFGLPALGITLGAWASAALVIAIHSSSYLAEVIKVAYQSIPSGQRDAAKTLGLTRRETLVHVVWPQMLPLLSAPSLNTLVATIKDSAIVSVISVHELTMQAQQLISSSFRPMEFYLLTALLYFAITYPLLLMGRRMERRFRAKGLLHAG